MISWFKTLDRWLGTPLCYLLGLTVLPKPLPPKDTIRKIVAIKLVAMGDMLVLMPAVNAVRQQYPTSEIVFVTTPNMVGLVSAFSFIDRVIPVRFSLSGLLAIWQELRGFDLAIEMDHYYRLPSLLTWLAGIPHRVGFAIFGQGRGELLTIRVPYTDNLHEVETFGQLSAAVGAPLVSPALISPRFPSQADDQLWVENWMLANNLNQFVVIHPGTSATAKSRRWPADRFAALADQLSEAGYPVVFSGAKEEEPIISAIAESSHSSHFNLIGKTNLGQLLALYKKAALVISLDTGPMHLAAASGTPTLGLFGANTPTKWGPYGPQHRAIYHGPDIPCTQQQYGRVCRHPEGYHMIDITVEEVVRTAQGMLEHSFK